jgi:probable F420-dependent oxidoreductase
MRFAVAIPQFVADGAFDAAAFRTYLMRAEALGFESAWSQEQILGSTPILGPIETMAYAAACTERLRLGCAVFVAPLHSPVHLAKSISTLDQLSRGRIEVGVGTGAEGRMFSAFGVDPKTLVARFSEGLQLTKALLTDPEVTFNGRFWQMQGARMEPKAFQKPRPRIWFGANQPAALKRAVRHGDGFFGAGSTTTARFAEQVQFVRETLADMGRDASRFSIAKRVYITVDDDMERARQTVTSSMEQIYGAQRGPGLVPVAVYGPPDACAEGIGEVAKAGAELVLFTQLTNQAEQMERLAAEVVPKLSSAG